MDRRIILASCAMLGLVSGLGCNLLDKRQSSTAETMKTESGTGSSVILDELKTDSQTLSGAHSGGRMSGGWSKEAREIESHFNVQ